MLKAKQLKEKRGTLKSNIRAMIEKAQKEERELTAEEIVNFDKWKAEIAELDPKIERAEAIEAEQREAAFERAQRNGGVRHFNRRDEGGEEGDKKKTKKRYRVTRAITAKINGKPLTGIELEMHQEAEREARAAGVSITSVGIPSFVFAERESRDLTAGSAPTAGNLIATELSNDLIEALRPRLVVGRMGAVMLDGLTSNFDVPKQSAISTAEWAGEITELADTNPETDLLNVRPKRLGAKTKYSKQLVTQSSFSVENMVRNDLQFAIANAVDLAAINGSGDGNVPRGILNYPNIGALALAAASPATRKHAVDLKTLIKSANADMGTMGYIMNPKLQGHYENTKTDAGSGQFVMNGEDRLLGYNVGVSTNVPDNLTDGGDTDLLALIFGNFSQLVICNWAGVDLLVNPYTFDSTGQVQVTVNSWWDIYLRHEQAFAAAKKLQATN